MTQRFICYGCGDEFLTQAELDAHQDVPIFVVTGTHQTLSQYEASYFGGDTGNEDEPDQPWTQDLPTEAMVSNWNEANDYTREDENEDDRDDVDESNYDPYAGQDMYDTSDDARSEWEAEQYQTQFDE